MGGIVKSIGKTIKKIGKGISKFIKKIGPALILAAAVWAGVSVFGAFSQGTLASGGIFKSIFSTQNFGAGLTAIGKGIGNALMPGTPFGSIMQQGAQAVVQDGRHEISRLITPGNGGSAVLFLRLRRGWPRRGKTAWSR